MTHKMAHKSPTTAPPMIAETKTDKKDKRRWSRNLKEPAVYKACRLAETQAQVNE